MATAALKQDLLRLLRTDPEFREAARREILGEEILSLPARLDALTTVVHELSVTVRELEVTVKELAAAQRRTEARLDSLTLAVQALTAGQQGIQVEVVKLSEWMRGERGRRDGERYERDTIRRAVTMFCGGQPLAECPEVRNQVYSALGALAAEPPGVSDAEDPMLADLIWVKGSRMALAEISRHVDDDDVVRAVRRSGTLQRAGFSTIPMVIGRDWAADEVLQATQEAGVEWRVGDSASVGFAEFRRMPAPTD